MSTAEELIHDYARELCTGEFAESRITADSLPALLTAACRLAAGASPAMYPASLLVRDLAIGAVAAGLQDAARQVIADSGWFAVLGKCLESPFLQVRLEAVYGFGKMTFPETVTYLDELFPARLADDPILLVRLVQERLWLDWHSDRDATGRYLAALAAMAAGPEFTRWAAAYLLHAGSDEIRARVQAVSLQRRLRHDPSPDVAAEAEYGPAAGREPRLDFEGLQMRLLNLLGKAGSNDYTLADLEDLRRQGWQT